MIIDNAENAVRIACEKTDSMIRDYTVAPVYFSGNEKAAHEWLIEFEKQPDDIINFAAKLDNALKHLNSDYEAKRYHDLALRMPVIRILEPDTFYNWLKSKNKLGGQHKIPRLSNNRDYLEQLLSM